MNKTMKLSVLALTAVLHTANSAYADISEAPSTVNAKYVEPSATRILQEGEKIDSLFKRNGQSEYVLQRLTERTYWVQRYYYSTIFYVGDKGVLLFDPLDNSNGTLQKAIASVTDLPVTAIVYSHNHADHIGKASEFVEGNDAIRIIASAATVDQQKLTKSAHPKPTETVTWPNGSFKFEGLEVSLHGFEDAAHALDHGVWLLEGEDVAHLPDLINPDQPPFWAFAGSETFMNYENNIEQLAELDWKHLNGGHGNVGSQADVEFYREFVGDLKKAVGKAMGTVSWGVGVDASKVNAHTPYLPAWLNEVSKQATAELRPKYGKFYGFEAATLRNAEMVAIAFFDYR